MAECSEISLLLGAFEDGELEPNEMQEVAFHLARCNPCTAELAGLGAVGRELRSLSVEPDLSGFTAAVKARIDNLPVPLAVRISRTLGRAIAPFGAGFAWGTIAAAMAVLTVFLITPYAERISHRSPRNPVVVASRDRDAVPDRLPQAVANDQAAPVSDSHVVISRLEAEMPSVAVWSEPKSDTTVIWLPDQR